MASRASRFLLAFVRRLAFVGAIAVVLVTLPAYFEVREPKVLSGTELKLPLEDIEIKLTLAGRAPRPTAMAVRYGDDAFYVTSKKGEVWRLQRGKHRKIALDITEEVSTGYEQGLLGLAFTPDGERLVINFTNKKDSSVTRVYDFDGEKADEATGENLLVVKKPAKEHNAGNLAFGPDGYLYVSIGDGGLSGDPDGNAQSTKSLLGKIHRISVLPDRTYAIPDDNPFVGDDAARGEIWAYGFRNPWRFSFDKLTGDLWIADVGRDQREEINFEPAGSGGGRNYGWNRTEGSVPYKEGKAKRTDVRPVHDYEHDGKTCAATGGFVYRGSGIQGLDGAYLFSDFCKGGVEALRLHNGSVSEHRVFDDIKLGQISSFGQDAGGELYVLSLTDGGIYRIDPA